jgi:DNA-binding transcriptional ArsR family regulator
MPVRKMRVEVYDESGNRYTVSLEGRVTRKKALRILDMVELLGGMPGGKSEIETPFEDSKIDKVRFIVEKHLPLIWFSAKDAQLIYEKEMNEQISLSTITTYLSRLSERGMLLKNKKANRVLFRLVSEGIKQIIDNI